MSVFRKAERRKAKLRLAITGPAGSGKTYGALLIALGLEGKIAVIDTENGSANLYAHLGDFDTCQLTPPFDPRKYIQTIHEAENEGYNVIIIDSLSHEWAGEGGSLSLQGKIANTKYRGNTYAAWRDVTPLHDALIQTILASPCHIIATMRSKTDYANDNGKPIKVGLAPVQRDGMDYEFSLVFDLNNEHTVTVSKDRTSLFDGQSFSLSPEVGSKLLEWLNSGKDIPDVRELNERKQCIYREYLARFNGNAQEAQNAILAVTQGRGSKDWTVDDLNALQVALDARNTPEELPKAVNL